MLSSSVFLPDGACLTVGTSRDRGVWVIVRKPDGKYDPPAGWLSLMVARPGHAAVPWRASGMPSLTHDGKGLVLIDVSGLSTDLTEPYVPQRLEYRHGTGTGPMSDRFAAWYPLGGPGNSIVFVTPPLL